MVTGRKNETNKGSIQKDKVRKQRKRILNRKKIEENRTDIKINE